MNQNPKAPALAHPFAALTLAILSGLTLPNEGAGQVPEVAQVSASAGIGVVSGAMAWQFAASRHLEKQREIHLRFLGAIAILGSGNLNDLGVLYGVRHDEDPIWLAFSVGPTLTWERERECARSSSTSGWFGCNHYDTVGRDWRGGVAAQATIGLGVVSLSAVGTLNTIRSVGGMIFSVHLGHRP